MKGHVLITLADKNFIPQAKQLFSSAYWNGGWQGDFLLLAHEIPEEDLRWFREKGIIVFPCKPLSERELIGVRHPPVVLDKFYLFTPFFKQWKRIVFLDADIIVKASLDRLVETKGFCAPNATCVGLTKEFFRTDRKLRAELERTYPLRGKAFNTGVFAFDAADIAGDTFEKMTALYEKFGSLNFYGEEGTFNLFFYKKWTMLPVMYNAYPTYMRDTYNLGHGRLESAIIHFVGETNAKPWLETSLWHGEWVENLRKADGIDLLHPQGTAKIWTQKEERDYIRALPAKRLHHLIRRKISTPAARASRKLWDRIEHMIGQTGLFIKKLFPRLYERIRIKHD